mgnify:FL=1|uniref:DNA-directed RNA polymerase M/15kDa subunit domain-containing protein n=1 Tax=viral metagenome TaxID=1070528 RepID=A0A6C0F7G4_9ZZZZ|tara:strand:- start:694 stop:1056 length:363 start_codon:yes stop_codon:yes gene_type:complete
MEIEFCKNCDNLLFLYSEEDEKKLYYGCKTCGEKQAKVVNQCIYNNTYDIDLSETINSNQFLKEDVTLPTIKDNPNIKCPNADCESVGKDDSEIVYIKYDGENMKYLYVCKSCQTKWTNQ